MFFHILVLCVFIELTTQLLSMMVQFLSPVLTNAFFFFVEQGNPICKTFRWKFLAREDMVKGLTLFGLWKYKTFGKFIRKHKWSCVTFLWFLAATIFYWGQWCNSCPWAHESMHWVGRVYSNLPFKKQS